MTKRAKSSVSLGIFAGALSGWASHAIGFACIFFLTPIILNGLGTVGYGIWSLIVTVSGYYGLVDLGVGVATTKFLAGHVARGDDKGVAQVLGSSLRTYCGLASLIVLISAGVGLALPRFVESEEIDAMGLFWVALLLGGNAASQIMATTFRSYLKAHRAFTVINGLGVFVQVISAASVGFAVTRGGKFLAMAMILCAVGWLTLALIAFVATWRFGFPWRHLDWSHHSQVKELFKFGGLVVAARVIQKVSRRLGTLCSIWIGGPVMVAYYSIAETACDKSLGLLVPVRQMIVPTASAFSANENARSQDRFIVIAPRMFLTMGLGLMVLLISYGKPFLELWIGGEMALATWPVLVVLAMTVPLRALGSCFGLTLQGVGEVTKVTKIALSEGAVLCASAILFGWWLGGIGLAWAVLTSTAFGSLIMAPRAVANVGGRSWGSLLFAVCWPALLTAFSASLVVLLLQSLGPADSYFKLGVRSVAVSVIGGAVAWLVCADQVLRSGIRHAMTAKLPILKSVFGAT